MKTMELTRLRVADSVLDLIGETPMVRLRNLVPQSAAEIFVKLEYLNPGGSIKDRAALGIVRRAEEEGKLKPGSTIVEATAGNTGIGLALVGVSRGYKVIICMPAKFSKEKRFLTRALGAHVITTADEEGMEGAIRRAKQITSETPGAFMAGQFENRANPDFHQDTTGREIWEQMEGRVDAIAIGAGTSGTFTGVARYLKKQNPRIWCVTVETQGSVYGGGTAGDHRVEGIGSSFIPTIYDQSVCDEVIAVSDEDAFAMVGELARKEGVLAGSSAGANVFASLELARRLGTGKRIATIIPDSAERYMSKDIFGFEGKQGQPVAKRE
jgi:cysteine synthase